MTDDDSDKDSDKEIFRRAMRGVRPLDGSKKVYHQSSKKKSQTPKKIPSKTSLVPSEIYIPEYFPMIEANEFIEFYNAGLQISARRKLRQGKFKIIKTFDLHGMTKSESAELLNQYLSNHQQAEQFCLKVIHGKGSPQPILKSFLNFWLRQHENVLGFSSARSNDGGTGAIYVLCRAKI